MRACTSVGENELIKVIARLLGCALLLLATVATRAEIVRDLYAAEVPVASQTSAARDRAARVALAQVLVKVSGRAEVLQNPSISAALKGAGKHVQKYAYNRDRGPEGELTARFEFDGSYVTRLITEAQAPLWTANRPLVLVWLVIEDANGRQFVNWDSTPELAAPLMREFSRRGVPVQLPLFDLVDATAISPDQVWRLDSTILLAASGRYNVKDVLGGRLATLSNGSVAGDWLYLYGDNRLDRSGTVDNPQLFFENGVALVAEEMASRYAVAPSATATEEGLSMSVAGVNNYADYAGVVAWLESLELVEHANVTRITGDRIELRVVAQADAVQLAALIELNERFVPEPATAPDPALYPAAVDPNPLSYRWQN
jgi:uncharacterized protein